MAEVAGEHAPAEVPEEARFPVVGTATEAIVTEQAADPSLDPGTPTVATAPRARTLRRPLDLTGYAVNLADPCFSEWGYAPFAST